jgi:hypothetical protein
MLKACFEEYPEIVTIGLIGWTPGFNDGEPCTHSDEVILLTNEVLFDSFGSVSDDFGYYLEKGESTEQELRDMLSLGYDHGQSTFEIPESVDLMALKVAYSPGKKHSPHLGQLWELLKRQPLAHLAYDTDYALIVTRDGKNVSIDHREYWVGH